MSRTLAALLFASASIFVTTPASMVFAETPAIAQQASATVHYRSVKIDGVNVFYREAGPADGPVVVLLHGFPTSSHMFRNLPASLLERLEARMKFAIPQTCKRMKSPMLPPITSVMITGAPKTKTRIAASEKAWLKACRRKAASRMIDA